MWVTQRYELLVSFNVKLTYRITRADSNGDNSIIVPETQEDSFHVVQNDETGVIEDSQTSPNEQQISNILILLENSCSSLEAVKKRFIKIGDHLIGLGKPISATHTNSGNNTSNFYINFLKNRLSELEKQLADKNVVNDFFSARIISKLGDIQKNKRSVEGGILKKRCSENIQIYRKAPVPKCDFYKVAK